MSHPICVCLKELILRALQEITAILWNCKLLSFMNYLPFLDIVEAVNIASVYADELFSNWKNSVPFLVIFVNILIGIESPQCADYFSLLFIHR